VPSAGLEDSVVDGGTLEMTLGERVMYTQSCLSVVFRMRRFKDLSRTFNVQFSTSALATSVRAPGALYTTNLHGHAMVILPFLTDAKSRAYAAIKEGRPSFALCGLSLL